MKKTLKLFILITALIAALLLGTGCGAELGASMSPPGAQEEESVVSDDTAESSESDLYQLQNEDTAQTEDADQIEEDNDSLTSDDRIVTVVLNTNKDRMRIHIPNTSCADQIHEENFQEWTGTADELKEYAKENGYVACGRCHPERELNINLPIKKK